jgi:hypothetical protein
MNTITRTPGSPTDQYRKLREGGDEHKQAVATVAHCYGYETAQVEAMMKRARREVEHPEPIAEPEPVAETPEPDRFDAVESEIRARIAQHEQARSRLALDAMTDDAKARELADVEARLAGAQAELARLGLARAESQRREKAELAQAERQARKDRQKRASELQAERQKAAAKIDKTARAFADALAAHQAIAAAQAGVLDADWQRVLPAQWQIECGLAHALREAGAPTPFEPSAMVRYIAPFAALDPHLVDPPK